MKTLTERRKGKRMNKLLLGVTNEELRQIKRIRNSNNRILSLYARLLTECPKAIKKELMDELCADGTDETDAYVSVLSYIFDLDEECMPDKDLIRRYLIPSVKKADPRDYLCCEYRKILSGKRKTKGDWEIGEDSYAPYEAFPCGEGTSLNDFTEYPQIAFFDKTFTFPTVSQNGVEWMSLKPNEIETMRRPIDNAFGNVTVLGLGLGYFAYCASQKENVKSVTVVERDADVISLFEELILPEIPHKEKIRTVKADAFDYMQNTLAKTNTDYVFTDLWHDTSDGLPLYLKAKRLEHNAPHASFDYWIEQSLLRRLRWLILEEYTSPDTPTAKGLPEIYGIAALREIMKDEALRALAKTIELD